MTKWGTTPTWVATISIVKEEKMTTITHTTLFLSQEEFDTLFRAEEIVRDINNLFDLDEEMREQSSIAFNALNYLRINSEPEA